jgi:predicted ArsR family transcriptional regulator
VHDCPFADVVHENQPVICARHEGMTRGLLDVLVPQAEFTGSCPTIPTTRDA